MARQFLIAVDLAKNELQNARVHNLASAPSSPVTGQLYYSTADNTLYWWDNTTWQPAKSGAPAFGTVVTETAFAQASNNGALTTAARSDHTHGTPTHDAAAHSAIPLSALAVPTADVSFNSRKLTNLATPTTGTDAANKDYVDNLAAGLSWKDSVRMASTAQRALTGLTAIDGVTPVANDRVLLKNQTAPAENGIYLAQSGAWSRAPDVDSAADILAATVFVEEGTAAADTAWTMTTNAPITLGTTGLTWVQFGAGGGVTAGAGLTGTTTIDVVAADASIVVAADSIRAGYAGNGSAVTLARSDHNHDATYIKTFAVDCAANVLTTVTHNFNTRDVHVQVYRNSTPWDNVETDIERSTVNTVEVRFATAPAAAAYRIVVQGIDG